MSVRTKLITTYEPERVIQPIYTGGDVALNEQGRILASSLDEEALLTDLRTGLLLARIEGDGEVLTALSLTPSTSHLIACSRSLSMRIYALEQLDDDSSLINARLIKTLKPHTAPVVTTAIDGTGTLIATGGADGAVKVWDIRGGYATHTFRGHGGVISAIHFFESVRSELARPSRINKSKRSGNDLQQDEETTPAHDRTAMLRLATGGEDGKIRIWDLAKRKSLAILVSHVSIVRTLNYAPETDTLISGSRDKTAIIWDARTWTSTKVIPVLEGVEAVGFLMHGSLVYTGGEHGVVRLWNANSGAEVTRDQSSSGAPNAIVHILSNTQQQFLLVVYANYEFAMHSTKILPDSSALSGSIDSLPVLRRISGTHDEIIDLAYVTPDRTILAIAANSEDLRLVSLDASSIPNASIGTANYFGADVASLQGHTDIIICLTVDSSGYWLATGAKDNTARLWRIDQARDSYELYASFTGHAESIGAISLPQSAPSATSTPDSHPLDHPPPFLVTGSQDRTIKRWTIPRKISSGSKALYTRKAHDKDINALALSPTSHLFASASQDRTVKIWSTEEGETQGVLRGHKRGVWSVVFAPKDTPSISNDDGNSASSSRGLVLTGSGDKTLKIWSLNDYSCVRTLEGHTNSVLKVLWLSTPPPPASSDNPPAKKQSHTSQIASAGSDGLLKIWDPLTSLSLTTLDNHTDRIWALAFDPTTRALVSGGGDSFITFWKDTSQETALATSKAAVERVEQDQELQNCVREGRYREAITLALQLNHPARLLGLFQAALDRQPKEEGSISGIKAVDGVLANLSDEQLLALLMRVRDWNTNARTAPVAQRVLNVLVRSYSAERLAGLGKRKGGKAVVEALSAYTDRHYRRMEELWGESWVVDFLLGEMEQLGVRDEINRVGKDKEQDMIVV